jgi:hypothetical protein
MRAAYPNSRTDSQGFYLDEITLNGMILCLQIWANYSFFDGLITHYSKYTLLQQWSLFPQHLRIVLKLSRDPFNQESFCGSRSIQDFHMGKSPVLLELLLLNLDPEIGRYAAFARIDLS